MYALIWLNKYIKRKRFDFIEEIYKNTIQQYNSEVLYQKKKQ